MVEIVLKYKGKSETIQVASKWEELTYQQLLYVGEYWEAWRMMLQSGQSLLKAKALLFLELMMGNTIFNRKKRIDLIAQADNEIQYQLTELTEFIFNSNDLVKCPIKYIDYHFKKLYAPDDGLGNITALEFAFADDFFMRYLDKGVIEDLELMIACLYRPLKKGSHNRIVFDKTNIEKSLSGVYHLTYAQRQVILIWYMGCRKKIIDSNKELFSKDNQSTAKNKGWLPVILAMAGDKFGTFDQTGQTDLHLIFMELKELKERTKPKDK